MVYEIAAAVAAGAFLVLVIAIIMTLRSANKTLTRTTALLDDLSTDVQELVKKSSELVEETKSTIQVSKEILRDTQTVVKNTAEDVQSKIHRMDNLFYAVGEVGDRLRRISDSVAKEAEANSTRLGKVVSLVSVGMDIAKRFQKK